LVFAVLHGLAVPHFVVGVRGGNVGVVLGLGEAIVFVVRVVGLPALRIDDLGYVAVLVVARLSQR
jgi:hypothetical protein